MVMILQKDDKRLRRISEPVPTKEIETPRLERIIADMKTAMHKEPDAVAIAAPQIGVPLRIFVVSGKAIAFDEGAFEEGKLKEPFPEDLVCINPEIIKKSKKEEFMYEGCLSVRWLYGDVKRAQKATIRAYNEHGKKFTRGASGLLAQIFQHEVEHLEGILFIDKAQNLQEIPPESEEK